MYRSKWFEPTYLYISSNDLYRSSNHLYLDKIILPRYESVLNIGLIIC